MRAIPGMDNTCRFDLAADTRQALTVFISHDVENDGHIASALKDKLDILSRGRVKALVCSEDIPGGDSWRAWMDEAIARADLFVYLYSNREHDSYWLNYELGLFRGLQRDKPGPVCIRNTHLDQAAARPE